MAVSRTRVADGGGELKGEMAWGDGGTLVRNRCGRPTSLTGVKLGVQATTCQDS